MGMADWHPMFFTGFDHVFHSIPNFRMLIVTRLSERLAEVAFADQYATDTWDILRMSSML